MNTKKYQENLRRVILIDDDFIYVVAAKVLMKIRVSQGALIVLNYIKVHRSICGLSENCRLKLKKC